MMQLKSSQACLNCLRTTLACLPDVLILIIVDYDAVQENLLLGRRRAELKRTAQVIDVLLESDFIGRNGQLEWQDKFMGSTSYIDMIRAADLTQAVMWGIDCWNRLFVAVRTRIANVDAEASKQIMFGGGCSEFAYDQNRLGVETFFQRYRDGDKWAAGAHGGHGTGREVVLSSMGDEEFEQFRALLTAGFTEIERHNGSAFELQRYRITCH